MQPMALDLTKGMTLDLTKVDGLKTIEVGVNWGKIKSGGFFGFGAGEESVDLDLSAIIYGEDGKQINTVYYANLRTAGIRHSGDDRVGDSDEDDSDNETISIDLAGVDIKATKIVFVLVSFSGQDFGEIPYARMNLYNTTSGKQKIANGVVDITKEPAFRGKKSMVFAKLEKTNGNWSYTMVNEPRPENNLNSLITSCRNV